MSKRKIDTESIRNEASHALGKPPKKQEIAIPLKGWLWPLAFLLSLSMIGLQFPPGFLFLILILYNRFRNDRYDFIIMLTLLVGGYGMTDSMSFGGYSSVYAGIALSFIGIVILRKSPIVKKAFWAWIVYALTLVILALYSEELFSIQFRTILNYLMFIYFLVPLMVFSGKDFDIMIFFQRIFPYAIIICIFYILDSFIINGHLFIPCVFMGWERRSLFYDPYILPFGYYPRIYPPALYILALCVFPIARYYKLKTWHLIVIIGAFAATRTFTVISGLVVVYLLFRARKKQIVRYAFFGVLGFTALYFIDGSIPRSGGTEYESFFRIKSSIDQIINLQDAQDDKDLSEAGSGRIAQAIPKIDLLYRLDKEWVGFGFLDRYNNTVRKYVIENEYYENPDERIEVATNIEITVLQILITVGYIGLIVHILFYLYLYFIVRKLKYAGYFGSLLLLFAWFGIGGFEGWITMRSLMMIGLAFSVVLLANRGTTNNRKKRGMISTGRDIMPVTASDSTSTVNINNTTSDNRR